jgi:hypothetical protein
MMRAHSQPRILRENGMIEARRATPWSLSSHSAGARALMLAAAFAAWLPATAGAQATGRDAITVSAAVTALATFDSDLDSNGGSFHWTGGNVSGSLMNQVNEKWSVGFNVGYQYERWTFSSPSAFGSDAPWGTINRPSVGFNVGYQVAPDIGVFVAPQFEWSYETGATESGQNFGAVLGASKVFDRDHVIGVGVGIFHQIDETKAFPFVIVNWKLDDKWKINNPLRAGPAGGAGLELVYTPDDNWELAGGGTYRQYRFRLKDQGPNADGIGQNEGIPLFARLTRKLGPKARLDVWGGATVAGTLKLRDPNGNTLVSSDYNAAPFLAVTLSGTF